MTKRRRQVHRPTTTAAGLALRQTVSAHQRTNSTSAVDKTQSRRLSNTAQVLVSSTSDFRLPEAINSTPNSLSVGTNNLDLMYSPEAKIRDEVILFWYLKAIGLFFF